MRHCGRPDSGFNGIVERLLMRGPHRLLRLIRNALAMLGLLIVIVTTTPVIKWYAGLLAGPWYEPGGDILILLGADEPSSGFIGAATYWRSFYAVQAWRRDNFRLVVVSGGHGIAESMRELLVFEGIPADKILLENRSESTRENALFTAALVASLPGRKVLLTSDFHVYRSLRAFAKVGLMATPRPVPYAVKRANSWTDRWQLFLELGVETAKIVVYRARGWI
jgi:uncharacterized SAM-binding protein YcdF (DUF218 family)